ncbi:MAG: GDSL-type esterase/lipase family protein [Limisphaerales bacterium]
MIRTRWFLSLLLVAFLQSANAQSTNSTSKTPQPGSAIIPVPRDDKSKARFDLLTERVKANRGALDILFVGDSITQGWDGAGSNAWRNAYSKYKALNIGIGGDRTQHVLWRLDNGHAEGLSPKVTVLMIGTNNSGENRNTPEEIVEGVTAVVAKLREKFPQTKVLLLGIFPRGERFNTQRGQILQVNQALQHLADNRNVYWLDIGYIFIQPDGTISKEIMPDYLHLSPRAYQMWAEAMQLKLDDLLGR